MARNAMLIQDGFDLCTEVHLLFDSKKEKTNQRNPNQEGQEDGECVPIHFQIATIEK